MFERQGTDDTNPTSSREGSRRGSAAATIRCRSMSGKGPADEAQAFAKAHGTVDAVVQRIGHGTWDLILVDAEGGWDRWVFGSKEDAEAAAGSAGAAVHAGWTDELSQRVTRRDEWGTPGGTRRAR
jgi:hypothetical protein